MAEFDMARLKLTRADNLIVVAIILILLAILEPELPIKAKKHYLCSYCSIQKTESSIFGSFHKKNVYRETRLSRYWFQNVDPSHKHTWLYCGSDNFSLFRWVSSSSNAIPYSELVVRNENAALAMLKSLPGPASRKEVMLRLCNLNSPAHTSADKVAVDKVIEAYKQNPARKDWGNLLKNTD